jgi:predicted DNA-binding protein (MmcQ/YjbR family)
VSSKSKTAKAWLDAMPGAVADPGPAAGVSLYKVKGKMFAILELRRVESLVLKCDPELIEPLREKYEGIGHRGHLDRRFWISVSLDSDVPAKEIKRLIALSHELVCANLTRKQRAELDESFAQSQGHRRR